MDLTHSFNVFLFQFQNLFSPSFTLVLMEQDCSPNSVATSQVKNVGSSTGNVLGVTYDFIQDKIYWSAYSGKSHAGYQIWRANRDGGQVQTLLSMNQCKLHLLLSFLPDSRTKITAEYYCLFFSIRLTCRWSNLCIGFRLDCA